jgi:HD-GYP domain-containing protein (c-di-GMP phosphodiesterase class II)
MQHRFVLSAARWTSDESAWDELAVRTRHVVEAARQSINQDSFRWQDQLQQRFQSIPSVHGSGLLVVDSTWRLLGVLAPDAANEDVNWDVGQQIPWQASSAVGDSPFEPIRGKVISARGSHIALVYDLNDKKRLVAFSPGDSTTPSSMALLQTLSVAGILGFVWTCGMQGVVVYLVLSKIKVELDHKRAQSEEATLSHRQQLVQTRDAVIFGLAKLAESRDADTGEHLERISCYATQMASALRRHPKFREQVSPLFVRLIGISSALHDIGKVGVQDAILLKPGKLTDAERAEMQRHPIIGGECLQQIERRLGNSNFLQMAREIALYHHERWDGQGYPGKSAGDDIPLAARIVAIADVYDALSVRRVYKDALPHERCVDIIKSESGKHFDPELVGVFVKLEKQFQEIASRFSATSVNVSARHRELAGCEISDPVTPVLQDHQGSARGTHSTSPEVAPLPA